ADDGTLTPTARTILQRLQQPAAASTIATETGIPLFRVRSSLRELVEAGLLAESADQFRLTALGTERLAAEVHRA
ncbi:MAG: helix-turn-helix domain-containing protein, partial [Planctomycetales bacterium]|nr:helix-turn-helix domain-containing protein [Planctomycetales bacterium]